MREIRTENIAVLLPVSVVESGRRDIANSIAKNKTGKAEVKELRSYAKRDARIGGDLVIDIILQTLTPQTYINR